MTQLAHIHTFVRTVELGSFSAVAAQLGTSQPTVSKQIAALEVHLGCLLFQRSTRKLSLTADGQTFYNHAVQLTEALAQAEASVGKQRTKPSGILRIGCAVVFGRLHILPKLQTFVERFPDIQVELSMNDGFSDLIEDNLDLVVRVGTVTDASLVARQIGFTRRVVVATPGYLAAHGGPRVPQDLQQHNCIIYTRLAAGAQWSFEVQGRHEEVTVGGRLRVNNTEGVRAAILAGLGIGYVPRWHFVAQEIERGELVVLLKAFEPTPQPINAVYPTRKFLPPKVRAMVDFLAEAFKHDPQFH